MPVVDIFNGAIPDMRRQGYTLQAIGDEIGVTRERVRQILNRYYPGTQPQVLREYQVAKVIGCSPDALRKLRTAGKINPMPRGKHYLYDRNEIEKAYLAVLKACPHCGSTYIGSYIRCAKCRAEYKRYQYPFFSEEQKRKSRLSTKKWQKNNPERNKANQKRANAKSRAAHFARTYYRVVGKNSVLPIGTVFQAVKRVSYLLLTDGSQIPVTCVRIIG